MQIEIQDQTEDASESTKPVAPGTSECDCFDDGTPSLLNIFKFRW